MNGLTSGEISTAVCPLFLRDSVKQDFPVVPVLPRTMYVKFLSRDLFLFAWSRTSDNILLRFLTNLGIHNIRQAQIRRTISVAGAPHEMRSGEVIPGVVKLVVKLEKTVASNSEPTTNQKYNESSNEVIHASSLFYFFLWWAIPGSNRGP